MLLAWQHIDKKEDKIKHKGREMNINKQTCVFGSVFDSMRVCVCFLGTLQGCGSLSAGSSESECSLMTRLCIYCQDPATDRQTDR